MNYYQSNRRTGVSLLEVLISIGVISLGIFGVASLIPVAQYQVAQGTTLDRIAAFGPSAAAEFRIRNMGSPKSWADTYAKRLVVAPPSSDGFNVKRRAFLIDPLGVTQGQLFPSDATTRPAWALPRLNLVATHSPSDPTLALRSAQKIFYLADDVSYDRPSEQEKQPRRQYFVDINGRPIAPVPGAQLSWFATLSPIASPGVVTSDEFVLSIVVCKGRTPELTGSQSQDLTQKSEHSTEILAPVSFPGEIRVKNDLIVSELEPGDWLLVGKADNGTVATNWLYRWTQIIGTSDKETDKLPDEFGQLSRTFSISNDDWIGPGEIDPGANKMGRIYFVKGVESVFERTIRIQNTTAWDE